MEKTPKKNQSMENLTPMLQQYMDTKAQFPDAILLFRLGDFYEMFNEDAEKASKVLEITLTGRDAGKAGRMPMCGVPYHSVDAYIKRLIDAGFKVAVCDQVEDPKLAKGLVRREVTRVITPGTAMDPLMLEEDENNYLASVTVYGRSVGLAFIDISTGEFLTTEITGTDAPAKAADELAKFAPKECIYHPAVENYPELMAAIRNLPACSAYDERAFSPDAARRRILEQLGCASLEAYGCEQLKAAQGACGAALAYVSETQMKSLGHINSLRTYFPGDFMAIDPTARRSLELTESIRGGSKKNSLLGIMDRTVTAMGARLLRLWLDQPSLDPQEINARLDAVERLKDDLFLREDLRERLKRVYDLERLAARISYGSANARDLIALSQSLEAVEEVAGLFAPGEPGEAQRLASLFQALDGMKDVRDLISAAIVDDPPAGLKEGGLIRPGYSEEVDRLREAAKNGKSWVAALEARERERTGIKSLKVGFNQVFGYYIEVTKANLSMVPGDYIRKQTLANAERFITPELKEYEATILGAEERVVNLEYELFVELRTRIAREVGRIQANARAIAELDVLAAFAELAASENYVRPEIRPFGALELKDVRHPVVERFLEGSKYVPNDVFLDNGSHMIAIVTGPNMGGKSTYGKAVLVCVIMAHMGSFVPASKAVVPITDRVFVRAGSSEDLAGGASTFMVELLETASILVNATERSLIFIDELGRGTSTYDGMAIARAVVEYIHDRIRAKTIFATHYHELTRLEETLPGVKNYKVTAMERGKEVVFLYKVLPGSADRSYGINVARMAGFPRSVLARAEMHLRNLEAQSPAKARQISLFDVPVAAASSEEASHANGVLGQASEGEADPLSAVRREVADEILAMDLYNMTPLQVAQKVEALKRMLEEAAAGRRNEGTWA